MEGVFYERLPYRFVVEASESQEEIFNL